MSAAPSLARHFSAEAHNNAWANHRLLSACCQLTQEEFAAPRTSFFPSIKATLNHILIVDWYYIEILERSVAGLPPADNPHRHFDVEEPFDTCADLSREQHAADRRLIALCKSLADDRMGIPVLLPRREGIVRDTLERILQHLFQHDIHHRGQVHAMLAGTRVKPPQLDDFYCANDAPVRAGDFAELGFSEEEDLAMKRRDALRQIGLAAAAVATGAARGAPAVTEESMLFRPIPSTRELLPVIGIGTWQTFDVGSFAADRAPLEEVLKAFAEMGGAMIDSSPMYGRSEEVVGDLVAKTKAPANPFIATKVWTSGKDEGIRQMRDSMRKLRVKVCDLMQVHNLLDVDTHLDTLAGWKRDGTVRYVGVTHYTASGADAVAQLISRRDVDFVQINYSVAERDAESRLLPLCRDKGVAVIANRPFAGGEIFRRVAGKTVPDWAAEIDCASWAQLMLKFIVSHPAITCAIPASAKPEHTRDNMKGGYGRMPDEAMRRRIIDAIAQARS